METVQEGIETADEILFLYDKVLDRVVPWKELNANNIELGSFRKDYSGESAVLIGEVKTLLSNGIEGYKTASHNVYEWTSLVTPLLTTYISLSNLNSPENTEAQNYILLRVLDNCIEKLSKSQDHLEKSSKNLDKAAAKLVILYRRSELDFQEENEIDLSKLTEIPIGSETDEEIGISDITIPSFLTEEKSKMAKKFYDNLKKEADQASKDIAKIAKILNKEISHLENVKVQTLATKSSVNLDQVQSFRDLVVKSAQALLSNSDEYRKKHANNRD